MEMKNPAKWGCNNRDCDLTYQIGISIGDLNGFYSTNYVMF
jgi:hypothetical protein